MELSAFLSHNSSGLPNPHYPCQLSDGGLCSTCEKLEDLDSKVTEAKETLNSLIHQHHQARTEINNIHSPIIHRILPEIASSIFEFCVFAESDELFSHPFNRIQISAPLLLGAICRTWRQIVWATPRLWTCLSITLNLRNFPDRCKLVQEWLGRSGQLPLSIDVGCDIQHAIPKAYHSSFLSLIDILNRYSARWQYLRLSIPGFLLSQFVANTQDSSAPVLKNLQLHPSDALQTQDGGYFISTNGKPNPMTIKTSSMRFKAISIEWNNATRVELDWLHLDECLELLQCAPKLTYCAFDEVMPPDGHFPLPLSPIVHNALRELDFSAYDSEMVIFFAKLHAPALEVLTCSHNEGGGLLPSGALIAFLRRSACNLQELYIQGVMAEDKDLFTLLQGTPSLRDLSISPGVLTDDFPNNFFELLGTTSMPSSDAPDQHDQKSFLPNLRSLTYIAAEQPFDWHTFSGIFGPLSSIKDPRRRPLQTAKLFFNQPNDDSPFPYIDQDSLFWIYDLQDAGIHLEFILDGVPLIHRVISRS